MTINFCDCDECRNSEFESTVYTVEHEASEFINTYLNLHIDHICQSCAEYYASEYTTDGNLFSIDDFGYLNIRQKYLDTPSLLK